MNVTRAGLYLVAPALLVLLAACEWKAEPARTAQALPDYYGCSDDDEAVPGYRIPCGEHFTARVRSAACAAYEEGRQCVCHARGKFCPDAGAHCGYHGAHCECGDDRGAIYTCDCEGDGDQCACWIPPGNAFSYDSGCN